MLAYGADVNTSNFYYSSALAIAIDLRDLKEHNELAPKLIEHGAHIIQPTTLHGLEYANAVEVAACCGSWASFTRVMDHAKESLTEEELNSVFRITANKSYSLDKSNYDDRMSWLLDDGADIATARNGVTALHLVAKRLNTESIHNLLRRGAKVSATCDAMESVLQAAFLAPGARLHMGDQSPQLSAVFELLLQASVDIGSLGGPMGDVLQAAAAVGRDREVQQLLSLGAKVNFGIGQYGSAFHAAGARGHTVCTAILLDNITNVDTFAGPYGTALQAAASRGSFPGFELHQACNRIDLLPSPPLERTWYQSIYQQVESRYCEDFRDVGGFRKAGQTSARKTLDLLLQAGADPGYVGAMYGSPLLAACFCADIELVEALLMAGANPEYEGGILGSCLQAVCASHKSVPSWGGNSSSSLSTLSFDSVIFPADEVASEPEDPRETILAILLETGARRLVNNRGGFFDSCLQEAVASESIDIIKQLLEIGAVVVEDGRGFHGGCLSAAITGLTRTPWRYLERSEKEVMLGLLLEHTEDERFNDLCDSALQRAEENDDKEAIELLKNAVPNIAKKRQIEMTWLVDI